jgi:hypothetical protein
MSKQKHIAAPPTWQPRSLVTDELGIGGATDVQQRRGAIVPAMKGNLLYGSTIHLSPVDATAARAEAEDAGNGEIRRRVEAALLNADHSAREVMVSFHQSRRVASELASKLAEAEGALAKIDEECRRLTENPGSDIEFFSAELDRLSVERATLRARADLLRETINKGKSINFEHLVAATDLLRGVVVEVVEKRRAELIADRDGALSRLAQTEDLQTALRAAVALELLQPIATMADALQASGILRSAAAALTGK